jgi:hypothetical protein
MGKVGENLAECSQYVPRNSRNIPSTTRRRNAKEDNYIINNRREKLEKIIHFISKPNIDLAYSS